MVSITFKLFQWLPSRNKPEEHDLFRFATRRSSGKNPAGPTNHARHDKPTGRTSKCFWPVRIGWKSCNWNCWCFCEKFVISFSYIDSSWLWPYHPFPVHLWHEATEAPAHGPKWRWTANSSDNWAGHRISKAFGELFEWNKLGGSLGKKTSKATNKYHHLLNDIFFCRLWVGFRPNMWILFSSIFSSASVWLHLFAFGDSNWCQPISFQRNRFWPASALFQKQYSTVYALNNPALRQSHLGELMYNWHHVQANSFSSSSRTHLAPMS